MQAPTQMISVQIILKYLTLPASLALLHRRTQSKSLCGPILNEDALPPSPLSYIGATFFDESDAGIQPVLLYWKYKPQAGKVTRRTQKVAVIGTVGYLQYLCLRVNFHSLTSPTTLHRGKNLQFLAIF